jgi:hypothetical protein
MLTCARDVCPRPIKNDCSTWLTDLDRDAPTVVFGARDAKGNDLVDVKVSMDGTPIQERLDGKPTIVDSGEHTFRFETKDGAVRDEHVLVRAGEKARAIVVSFPSAEVEKDKQPKAPAVDKKRDAGSLVPTILVAGIGVVALGSFAAFGITGESDVDGLQHCKPNCAPKDVDRARTKLIMADVSLGIGVVALGVAAYMFFTRPTVESSKVLTPSAKNEKTDDRWLRFDAGPIAGGAYAGIGGAF